MNDIDNQDSAELYIYICDVGKKFKISYNIFDFLAKKLLTPKDYVRDGINLWPVDFDYESGLWFGIRDKCEITDSIKFAIFTEFSGEYKMIRENQKEPPFLHVNINGEEGIFKISEEMFDVLARKLLNPPHYAEYKKNIIEKSNTYTWDYNSESDLRFATCVEMGIPRRLIIFNDGCKRKLYEQLYEWVKIDEQ